jgi:hypothetical protein
MSVLRSDEQPDLNEFLSEDFDAYLPEKWNSNMFTLPRRKVKDKLELIGRHLDEDLNAANLSLIMRLSDEFPSLLNKKQVSAQWLFFSRDEEAQAELTELIDKERTLADTLADPTPRFRQIFLGLSMDQDHLEIGMRLHYDAWVDRNNTLKLLDGEDGRNQFATVLGTLPDHYTVDVSGADPISPSRCDSEAINSLRMQFEASGKWLFIGARLTRDQVVVLGSDIVNVASEAFQLLVPVYRFLAWSPTNDAISIDTLVAEQNEARKATHEELERERSERKNSLKEKEALGLKLREEIADRVRDADVWRQREMAARRSAAARSAAAEEKANDPRAKAEAMASSWGLGDKKPETVSTPATPDAPKPEKTESKPSSPRPKPLPGREVRNRQDNRPKRTSNSRQAPSLPRAANVSPERAADIRVSDLVEIIKGFLKGRRGTVQNIDEKGEIRVNFGAVASRFTLDDVKGLGPVQPGQYSRGKSSSRTTKRS